MLVAIISNMTGLVELFLLGVLLYWLFGSSGRLFPMADMLSTLYTSWERNCTSGSYPSMNGTPMSPTQQVDQQQKTQGLEPRASIIGLRMFGYARRTQNRTFYRNNEKQYLDNKLFLLKSQPLISLKEHAPRNLINRAPCCSVCTPASRRDEVQRQLAGLEIHNVLVVKDEGSFFRKLFKHIINVWEIIKYPYPEINKEVLADERVKTAIRKAAQCDALEARKDAEGSRSREGSTGYCSDTHEEELDGVTEEEISKYLNINQKRANQVLQIMRSKLSDFWLRMTSWVLYKLLPMFLSGVVVKPEQVAMLREAASKGVPLIFLPLHRSHLDYILMSFILLNNGVKAPLVAAGDNLKIPVFGWLLRGLGAFYIKRKIDPATGRKDHVYRSVLHTYMAKNLQAGHYVEFFIEGGRTRTGKTCMPKGGLLSVIVDAQTEGLIKDALIVPVSINYERIVDGNFIREQLGQSKIMENFTGASKAIWSVLKCSYGMMRVDFSHPFSVKELVKAYETSHQNNHRSRGNSVSPDIDNKLSLKKLHRPPSSVSLYGTDVVAEEQRNVVEVIARHVIYDCDRYMAIMSTNAVAFLLLHHFRQGATLSQLSHALDELRQDIRAKGREAGFSGDSVDVITHAIRVLGPGVVQKQRISTSLGDTIFIKPVINVPNVIELSYYGNGVLSLYVLEAVIATALCSLQPNSTLPAEGDVTVNHDLLLSKAIEICYVLQFEFIFTKPCQSIEQVMRDTIDDFYTLGYLRTKRDLIREEDPNNKFRPGVNYDPESDDYVPPHTLQYIVNHEYQSRLKFLCSSLRPLLEGYAACGACLHELVDNVLTEKTLLQKIRGETEAQLKIRNFLYEECLSTDPVKNALRLLEKWEMIKCYMHDKEKTFFLKDEYNTEASVQPVAEKLKALVCTVE